MLAAPESMCVSCGIWYSTSGFIVAVGSAIVCGGFNIVDLKAVDMGKFRWLAALLAIILAAAWASDVWAESDKIYCCIRGCS